MASLLVKNGRVVDPAQELDRISDVLLEDGKVSRVATGLQAPGSPVLDAAGLIVARV